MWWAVGTFIMQVILGMVVFIGGPALLLAIAMDTASEFRGD